MGKHVKLSISDAYVMQMGGVKRLAIQQSSIVRKLIYLLGIDEYRNRHSASWHKSIESAVEKFVNKPISSEVMAKLEDDINRCYHLVKSSPEEYFIFDFANKTDEEIKTYMTDQLILGYITMKGQRKMADIELADKGNFYLLASDYFKREVAVIKSKEDYTSFLKILQNQKKVIVKPSFSAYGTGIFMYEYTTEEDAKACFSEMMENGTDWVVEELIIQSDTMASWNRSSVNTIRVNTYCYKGKVTVKIPFIRTGREGRFVDNGGQGGVFACIDPATGRIDTDGHDEMCNTYIVHPNSKQTYKGWQVPEWDDLLNLAKDVHTKVFPKHLYVSWDFAHTDNGWVLIESNWGQFVCQQLCYKIGLKESFLNGINGRF